MTHSLTLLIVLLGATTVFLSIFVALQFRKHARKMSGGGFHLSRSLMWQLVGEGVLGMGTLGFAIMAYLGKLDQVPVYAQSILRLLMFLVTSLTTVHLYLTTARLSK